SAHHIVWSTSLNVIVDMGRCALSLNEDYIAGWLSQYPAPDLTPYSSVHSVAPGSVVRLRPGRAVVNTFDIFDPSKRIRYGQDSEYEEHFRSVFAESVKRCLRSDRPVLAELSGGMDSSSIVCMADDLVAGRKTEAPRVDTVSFYDTSEPNWDERPYFTKIEE